MVRFWDHTVGVDRPVTCKIYGWVVKKDRVSVTFSTWECEDLSLKPDNTELVTLLRSTFLEVEKV